jgi:hypothetical protein
MLTNIVTISAYKGAAERLRNTDTICNPIGVSQPQSTQNNISK